MSVPSRYSFAMKHLPWLIAAVAVAALAVTLLWKGSATAPVTAIVSSVPKEPVDTSTGSTPQRPREYGFPADQKALSGMRNRMPMTSEQIEAKRNQKLARLEASFQADRPDPVGGGKSEQALENVLAGSTMKGTGMVPRDASIDCKATSCRIVGSFKKGSDAEDWALFYLTAAAPHLRAAQMVLVPGADGSAEIHMYALRDGG
jgi:hypothetical protein